MKVNEVGVTVQGRPTGSERVPVPGPYIYEVLSDTGPSIDPDTVTVSVHVRPPTTTIPTPVPAPRFFSSGRRCVSCRLSTGWEL